MNKAQEQCLRISYSSIPYYFFNPLRNTATGKQEASSVSQHLLGSVESNSCHVNQRLFKASYFVHQNYVSRHNCIFSQQRLSFAAASDT